jgi:hypothetical protein
LVTPKARSLRWLNYLGITPELPVDSKLDSMKEYNRYVVFELFRHVETNHCLLIQADGYVLNRKIWTDEFLKYDYIGAPWPIRQNAYIAPDGKHIRVGNGGFSLRSRKLLLVPNDYRIEFNVHQLPYRHFDSRSWSEDGVICVHNREVYEAAGCVFAPIHLAARFSRELNVEDIYQDKTFGFHRYKKKPR